MTIGTGQLATAAAQMAAARQAANEATIEQNAPKVIGLLQERIDALRYTLDARQDVCIELAVKRDMLQERIATLEAANAALLAVAVAADKFKNDIQNHHVNGWTEANAPLVYFDMRAALNDIRAAGYLPTDEVAS